MGDSVRTAVEPMNTALNLGSTIFLSASFSGLPLVNQALAAENPLGGGAFVVTVRALMKVLSRISPAAVVAALAAQRAPPPHGPTPPPSHQVPDPNGPMGPMVTCSAEIDGANPGFGGTTNMRIFGGGFLNDEMVNVIEFEQVATTTKADRFGSYSVTMGVLHGPFPTAHTVRAHGTLSERTSNNAGFTV